MNLFSRRIVGWAMADHMRTDLVTDALAMAVAARRPRPGLVHHSDKGSQYMSLTFSQRRAEVGIRPSTGRTGSCYDNAVTESFFASLETELIDRTPTRHQAEQALFAYIEGFYNPRRRHSADGKAFTSFGRTYQLTWGGYRGDRVGLYTYNPNGTGYVDVDSVQYTIAPTRAYKCVSVRSGKVAGVSGASNADGAAVIQRSDTGRPNQQWAFQSTGDGYHTIMCVGSGKVLDVARSSLADGARVVQATADGTASQQWQLRPQTGGVFLVVNRNSGKVLDVRGGSTADGVALIQYRDAGGSNQRWTFHRVTG